MVIAKPTPTTPVTSVHKKPKHGFKRITHRGGKVGWLAEDKVRLTKKGGKKHVFLQIRKGGKWHNAIRQTTTKKGVFYFDAVTRKQHRLYKTKSFKIGKLPKRYSVRVVVPSNKKFAKTVSNAWTVSW